MKIGIVGLPNVGKSTLFNALLKRQQAFVANYPFATIEPNVGVVPVVDKRLNKLAEIEQEENKMGSLPPIIYATISFVDIAGLVKGASTGEGLGNKFLAHIREVDAIVQVVRYFKDTNVTHVSETPDPKNDIEIVNTELVLADLQTIENARARMRLDPQVKKDAIEKIYKALNDGRLAKEANLTEEETVAAKDLQLLTMKPMFIVANVSENQLNESLPQDYLKISAKVEAELSALSDEEQVQYLKELGVSESGLDKIIKKGYEILDLISFLTAGVKEVRAWTIKKGTNAQNAAGVIHTDFEKKFIKAEVVAFNDFVSLGGWKKSRELGKTDLCGRDYIIKDGEVVEFKIGS